MNDAELSKALSHALRHEPWLFELELDDDGWASLDAVLFALREQRAEWQSLTAADIDRVIRLSPNRRHEIDARRIRALYGHSVPGKLRRRPGYPPTLLFHGTSASASATIAKEGLRPMSRQYVHLSIDALTAQEVGRRKSTRTVVWEIASALAHRASVPFYEGNDKVWLADLVPSQFMRVMS